MAKKGPITGVRVPVKLPWKGIVDNQDQFVSMKKPVAEYLKLKSATKEELRYRGEIRYKEEDKDGNNTGAYKTKEVWRIRRPGYKQRSIKIIFGDKKTGKKKSQNIPGAGSYYSVSFPVTKSVSIEEIVNSFKFGEYKNLSVIRVEDVNTGQGYPAI